MGKDKKEIIGVIDALIKRNRIILIENEIMEAFLQRKMLTMKNNSELSPLLSRTQSIISAAKEMIEFLEGYKAQLK